MWRTWGILELYKLNGIYYKLWVFVLVEKKEKKSLPTLYTINTQIGKQDDRLRKKHTKVLSWELLPFVYIN